MAVPATTVQYEQDFPLFGTFLLTILLFAGNLPILPLSLFVGCYFTNTILFVFTNFFAFIR